MSAHSAGHAAANSLTLAQDARQPATSRTPASDEGTQIDIDALVRIADLFRFRWDPPVLAILAERPYRYRALHTRLTTHFCGHMDDNALSRSLHRLTRFGLVHADSQSFGSRDINTYALADKGRETLRTYEALASVYAHVNMSDDECDGSCTIHTRRYTKHLA
jgi:DNA-binding HxlR family transcriptional regulator